MAIETKTYVTSIEIHACCHEGCGVLFGLESAFSTLRHRDHGEFYCPNGHRQHFSGKNKEEQLTQELAAYKESLGYLREANARLHTKITGLNYSIRAQKAAKTKILNRVKNGVCPCCNRTFANLQRHFKTKHPELANPTE